MILFLLLMFLLLMASLGLSASLLSYRLFGIFVAAILLPLLVSGCGMLDSKERQRAARADELEVRLRNNMATFNWLDKQYGIEKCAHGSDLLVPLILALEKSRKMMCIAERRFCDVDVALSLYVIKSEETAAFSSDFGAIYLSKGLIKRLDNEADLLSVLAHEYAHVLLGHIASGAVPVDDNSSDKADEKNGGSLGAQSSAPKLLNSQEHEIEADAVGLRLLYYGGYNVYAAPHAILDVAREHYARGDANHNAQIGPLVEERRRKMYNVMSSLPDLQQGIYNSRSFKGARAQFLKHCR